MLLGVRALYCLVPHWAGYKYHIPARGLTATRGISITRVVTVSVQLVCLTHTHTYNCCCLLKFLIFNNFFLNGTTFLKDFLHIFEPHLVLKYCAVIALCVNKKILNLFNKNAMFFGACEIPHWTAMIIYAVKIHINLQKLPAKKWYILMCFIHNIDLKLPYMVPVTFVGSARCL